MRAACALLVSLTALAGLRAWMVLGEWHEFLRAYGRSHHLDMHSEAGWTESALRAPGQWSALLDLGLVLILVLLVLGVLHRSSECRIFGVVVSVAVTLDALAPLAYPVPWWYVVASSMLGAGVHDAGAAADPSAHVDAPAAGADEPPRAAARARAEAAAAERPVLAAALADGP